MGKHALQDILENFLANSDYCKRLPLHYLKVIDKLAACRTAALGGHAQYCENNHLNGIWYNSCKHRFCPQCRGMATEEWLINTKNILLNCPHHHMIFTLPADLNNLWRYNQSIITNILFQATQQTLSLFSKDPQYLAAKPAIICALHTWGRSLSLHPHIHTLISHGGINKKEEWVTPKKESLFPQKPLMMVYRGKLCAMLKKAIHHIEWRYPPDINETQFINLLNKLGRKEWIVHCCPRYEHATGVAKYLSNYVKSGPVKKQQMSRSGKNLVSFRYQSHQTKKKECLKLPVEQFVRRLIQHAPLKGKPTLRYSGLYNSSARKKLNQAREALGQSSVSQRMILQWQDFLASKGHEIGCDTCGSPITRMVDIQPFRKSA